VTKAISDEISTTKLYLSPFQLMGTLYHDKLHNNFVEVDTETLDHFFQGREQNINVVKMDIEGGEMAALSGMEQLIHQNENINIIIEFSPAQLEIAHLTPRDFLEKIAAYNLFIKYIDEGKKRLININNLDELTFCCKEVGVVNLLLTKHEAVVI